MTPAATAPAVSRDNLARSLRTLCLSGMLATLDARLAQAAAGDLGFLDFLQTLCLDEIDRRDTAAHDRRLKAARFDLPDAAIETFDFTADPAIPAAQIRDLAALDWFRQGRHLIIAGPVGCGKTHIATALARQAIRAGHTARFTTTSKLFADLAGGNADGTWAKRLRAYTRPDLVVLDDFALREVTGPQGDDLYELVSARSRRPIIVTTNRAPNDWYPLFPNAVVAESLFDRLVNNAIELRIEAGSHRARQRPNPTTPATTR
jgi:DNA replication protein DnaC